MTTEADLVERSDDLRVVLGDEVRFRQWYERMVGPVYSYVASRCLGDADLASDLTQETFVAAIRGRARFDGRSEQITWLCGIARHKLADHFRRLEHEEAKRHRATIRELQLDSETRRWREAEDRLLIAEALRRLPASQRAVLTFVAMDDLPVAEVARLMKKSFPATQSLLARARESFRRSYPRGLDQ